MSDITSPIKRCFDYESSHSPDPGRKKQHSRSFIQLLESIDRRYWENLEYVGKNIVPKFVGRTITKDDIYEKHTRGELSREEENVWHVLICEEETSGSCVKIG